MTTGKRKQTLRGPSALRADSDLTALVRRSIASSLAGGHPTMAWAAEAADMSVRTLQRRLEDLGLTYSRLLEDVRFETACRLLGRSEMSLAEVARALGYADPSNFVRAVRRWTGEKPTTFRRRLRQGSERRS